LRVLAEDDDREQAVRAFERNAAARRKRNRRNAWVIALVGLVLIAIGSAIFWWASVKG
jgi:hypothetical protein